MQAMQTLLNTTFTDVRWPVEYRTLAADDVWLSTAYQRDTVTISVHQDVNLPDADYYRACEEIFLDFDGRPIGARQTFSAATNWQSSTTNGLTGGGYETAWIPETFLNPYMKSIRP